MLYFLAICRPYPMLGTTDMMFSVVDKWDIVLLDCTRYDFTILCPIKLLIKNLFFKNVNECINPTYNKQDR